MRKKFNEFKKNLKGRLKETCYMKGFLFKFIKWSPEFKPPFQEPIILPRWTSFLGLAQKFFLFELLGSTRKPLKTSKGGYKHYIQQQQLSHLSQVFGVGYINTT